MRSACALAALAGAAAALVAGCGGGDDATTTAPVTAPAPAPADVGGPLPQILSLAAAGRIYVLRADEPVRALGRSRGLLPSDWSPDGALLLARGSDAGVPALLVLTIGGNIPPRTVATGLTGATWSPDGSRIAARRGGAIVVFTPGGDETRVGATGAAAHDPGDAAAWSPDGRRLVFAAAGPGGAAIAIASTAGGAVSRIAVGSAGTPVGPAWSPDGTTIAFGLQGGVHVVGADGGDPRRLASGSAPAWSPDGTRIAFVGPRAGPYGVVSADGREITRLARCRCSVSGALSARTISWSSNGDRLAYVSGPGNELSTVRPDGSEVTVAVRFPGPPPRRVLWVPRPG